MDNIDNLSPLSAAIILVSPQLGENIGAVARSMANFGFSDLRIVNPRDGWPNEKARATAAHAISIIDEAMLCSDLSEALQGCEIVYACSARMRNINKKNIFLRQHVEEQKKRYDGKKIAIMFGSERCGLLNDEVVFAHEIINIPASDHYPVLNLSHAASFVMYEYFLTFSDSQKKFFPIHRHKVAEQAEVKSMIDRLDQDLDKTNFYKDEDRRVKMVENIHNIFVRTKLSRQEVRTLSGIFKYLFFYKGK